jgi:GTPase SAR1 family protein
MESDTCTPYPAAASSWQPTPHTSSAAPPTVRKLKCIVLGGAGAGKTSILRRYFHGNFDPRRMPTLGSDFYSRKIPDPRESPSPPSDSAEDEKKEGSTVTLPHPKALLSMQVWDTPGRERYAANRKPMYTAAFSDNFFKNADAALLLYDITSSTSFTHVLKWHADLMERIRRLEAMGERTRPFPALIVANKMDILVRDTHPSRQQAVVLQRDVIGLTGKTFRGKDSRYEYSACPPPKTSSTSSASSSSTKMEPLRRQEISTYMGTGDQTSYLQAVLNNDVQGSYLESLLSTEDGSHPDKDMVLLWCMRNGLKHMEVSALDGTGIDELMNEMVQMALTAQTAVQPTSPISPPPTTTLAELQRNDELDLHRRYDPKPRSWPFHRCCKP